MFSGVLGGIKWENWSEIGFVLKIENRMLSSAILVKIA